MSSEIARRLAEQTQSLVSRFEGRVSSFAGRDDLLGLLREVDARDADAHAKEVFGEGEHLAAGIDGSMELDERLQMMLFYSNATAYTCPFSVGDRISFNLRRVARGQRLSASSAIPLWTEDLSDVASESTEIDLELEHTMQRIPNAFMTLAELYLAVRATEESRIIFLDRPLSGTYSTLSRDARLLLHRGVTSLSRLSGESVQRTLLDLDLAVSLGSPSMQLPRRWRYTAQRMVRELISGPLSESELALRLKLDQRQVKRGIAVLKKHDAAREGELLEGTDGGRVALSPRVPGYWDRAVALATAYCRRVYEDGEPPLNFGEEEWLTVLDVNTMALIMLQMLCQLAKEKGILLIGIAKDTTATDIYRSVLPFAARGGFIDLESPAPRLKNDRAFLSILSSMSRGLEIPWRTAGYDSAFSTIVSAQGDVPFKSARKVVSREGLFVRGFFQSRSMGRKAKIRSPVFLFDRLFDPSVDSADVRRLEVKEAAGDAVVEPYFEGAGRSRRSNLVLLVLSLTDNPEVYEAFGHNQLLYLADKAVKVEMRQMKGSLKGVADLKLGSMSKREEVYGIMTPFRSQRATAEGARMRASGGE